MDNKALLGMGEKGAKKIVDAVSNGATVQRKAPEVFQTESGIDYVVHKVANSKTKEEREVRMFFSMSPTRLKEEDETREEYRMRRRVNADIIKRKKRGQLRWDPYMLKGEKGFSCSPNNRAVVEAMIKQQENE